MDDRVALIAQIAQQRCARCAKAKDGVFHDGRACADGVEEVREVVIAVVVPIR